MTQLLPFEETRRLLKEFGLPLVHTVCTRDPNEVRYQFASLREPAVLKATGAGLSHKTEKGLVFLSITCREQLDDCLKKIAAAGSGYSFLLQRQVSGAELIIGGKRDASFGPVVLFGTGGIYAELLDDVSVRPAPLSFRDATQMMMETHAKRFAKGFRGRSMNLKVMGRLLVKASHFIAARKEVTEFDFNPVIANEESAVIVDARVIVQ